MPVQYGSIVAEHQATRTAAGVFDISHMGRLSLAGPSAEAFLDRIVTRRATDMRPGQIRYALVTNEAGGILDDVLFYRLETAADERAAGMLFVNASNRPKIVDWLDSQRPPVGCEIHDGTNETAMIAVQGPRAIDLLVPLLGDAHKSLKYYYACEMPLAGLPSSTALVSRTGYTGEDGWEIIVDANLAAETWERIVDAGRSLGAIPAGLGARDTLRLEAAMPLYGHELTDEIDPYQAGLAFAVDLESRSFPGKDALLERRKDRRPAGAASAGKWPAAPAVPTREAVIAS